MNFQAFAGYAEAVVSTRIVLTIFDRNFQLTLKPHVPFDEIPDLGRHGIPSTAAGFEDIRL
jgi:hypothetical protein